NNTRATSPQDDSYGGNGSGPGNVDPKKLKEMAEVWGKLPERERAKAMADMTRDMPPRYREGIESYFRKLAADAGKCWNPPLPSTGRGVTGRAAVTLWRPQPALLSPFVFPVTVRPQPFRGRSCENPWPC